MYWKAGKTKEQPGLTCTVSHYKTWGRESQAVCGRVDTPQSGSLKKRTTEVRCAAFSVSRCVGMRRCHLDTRPRVQLLLLHAEKDPTDPCPTMFLDAMTPGRGGRIPLARRPTYWFLCGLAINVGGAGTIKTPTSEPGVGLQCFRSRSAYFFLFRHTIRPKAPRPKRR